MRGRLTGKYLIWFALLALVVGLVAIACGGDDDEIAAPAPAAPGRPRRRSRSSGSDRR